MADAADQIVSLELLKVYHDYNETAYSKYAHLTYDGSNIKDSNGNILSLSQIYALVNETNKHIDVTYGSNVMLCVRKAESLVEFLDLHEIDGKYYIGWLGISDDNVVAYRESKIALSGEAVEGNPGIAVTGATVGQTVKIAAVDDNGVPTAWEPMDLPSGGTHWEPILNEVWQRNRELRFTEYDADTLTYTFPDGTFTDDEIGTEIYTELCIDPASMPDTYGAGQSTLTPISGNQATIASAQHSSLDGKNYWFEIPTALSIKGINARKIRVRWDGRVSRSFQNAYNTTFAYGMPPNLSAEVIGFHQFRIARSIADIELELIAPYIVSGKQNAYIFGSCLTSAYNKKWFQSYSPVLQDVSKYGNYAYSPDGLTFANLYWCNTPWLSKPSVIYFIGNGTRIYVAREVEE